MSRTLEEAKKLELECIKLCNDSYHANNDAKQALNDVCQLFDDRFNEDE